ncbi:MAG: transcriptional regulator, LysR family [Firmicutes bacterium]|nr:transcriptional regulator, LysR family [Bacillota bacterium]
MIYNGVEAFLEICRSRTFSKAAETLHLTQSTVSRRIKLLEQELGAPLIDRNKGERTVYLTAFGEKFISVAERWKNLLQETHQLKTVDNLKLTIGAADSVNNYILPPLYDALYQQTISLRIRTQHSTELYSLVQNKDIDVGFVLYERLIPSVIVEPFLREKMIVLRPGRSETPDIQTVTPTDLDPSKELYASWNPVYDAWHNRFWDPFCARRIHIDSLPLLLSLFGRITESDYWVILPMSIAFYCQRTIPCTIQYLSEPPPDRTCYKITHSYKKADTLERLQLLDSHIQNSLLPVIKHYGTYIFSQE